MKDIEKIGEGSGGGNSLLRGKTETKYDSYGMHGSSVAETQGGLLGLEKKVMTQITENLEN